MKVVRLVNERHVRLMGTRHGSKTLTTKVKIRRCWAGRVHATQQERKPRRSWSEKQLLYGAAIKANTAICYVFMQTKLTVCTYLMLRFYIEG